MTSMPYRAGFGWDDLEHIYLIEDLGRWFSAIHLIILYIFAHTRRYIR